MVRVVPRRDEALSRCAHLSSALGSSILLIDIKSFDVYHSSMGKPQQEPIGLQVTRTAKVISRAFDHALAAAGG